MLPREQLSNRCIFPQLNHMCCNCAVCYRLIHCKQYRIMDHVNNREQQQRDYMHSNLEEGSTAEGIVHMYSSNSGKTNEKDG